jgi:hypothetical protein
VSTAILEAPHVETVALQAPPDPLGASLERLNELRFLVILTARWESSESVGRERRLKLRGDLARLRRQYSDKIDEIAMSFGVQQAMEAQELVEHTVKVPRGILSPEELAGQRLADDESACEL